MGNTFDREFHLLSILFRSFLNCFYRKDQAIEKLQKNIKFYGKYNIDSFIL